MMGTVEYGNTTFHYNVRFTDRKTLAVEVHPDGKVIIIAPISATKTEIQNKVEKRSAWITKQLRFFKAYPFNKNQAEWVGGETVYYLGRQYRLKIIIGNEDVKLYGKFLFVSTPQKHDAHRIKILVESWYLSHAKRVFAERIKRFTSLMEREKIVMNKLQTRSMLKRWGSCTKQRNIVLNSLLVKAPVYCIDYVIVHEICHLKYHDHSPRFWGLLLKHCPDWAKAKERLEHGGWNN